MTRRIVAGAVVAALAGTGAVATAGSAGGNGGGSEAAQRPLRYAHDDLYIETNATDRDAGLQLSLDAEDWRSFRLRDPRGRVLLDMQAKGRLRGYGLTELFFEASEPSFDESPFSVFKRRFPEGRYTFRGETVEGRRLVGSDTLSHLIPDGPRVTFPTENAQVDRASARVTWEPVTRPAGVRIVSYQVIVEQGGRELSVYLPPTATALTIPPEFLEPGRAEGEILARDRSGNQTITHIPRFTAR